MYLYFVLLIHVIMRHLYKYPDNFVSFYPFPTLISYSNRSYNIHFLDILEDIANKNSAIDTNCLLGFWIDTGSLYEFLFTRPNSCWITYFEVFDFPQMLQNPCCNSYYVHEWSWDLVDSRKSVSSSGLISFF